MWLLLFILVSLLPSKVYSSTKPIECDYQTLIGDDANVCSDNLHIFYPDIGDVSCIYIPNCFDYQRSLSKVWGPPLIRYSNAKPREYYTLIMVDPDAPSRSNPQSKFWRHWLIVNIPGQELLHGNPLTGKILSAYSRPTPPPSTGYHRYQFLIYLEPEGSSPFLLPTEEYRGLWNIDTFVMRSNLGFPQATSQFMARNPKQ